MKSIFGIVIMSILLCVNAFALSGTRKNIEYNSCYTTSINDGASENFSKTYCRCFAKKLDGKYTDKQLDALVDKGMEYMMKEIRPLAKKCFDKVS